MPHQPAAPAEADPLRPMAQAIAHARVPAALKLLLLALLSAVFGANLPTHTLRRPLKDWYLARHGESLPDSDSAVHPRVLRAIRRHRAWIGWILRCHRAEGMSLSGQRALPPSPTHTARAPPWSAHVRSPPSSVAKPRSVRRRFMPEAKFFFFLKKKEAKKTSFV